MMVFYKRKWENNTMEDYRKRWSDNKKVMNRKARAYHTEMSEIGRLFQRILMNGGEEHLAELHAIMSDTKNKMAELLAKTGRI